MLREFGRPPVGGWHATGLEYLPDYPENEVAVGLNKNAGMVDRADTSPATPETQTPKTERES
ncbi:MAG: hypothetical protein UT61_C0053G0009 [Candidatus Woesebacteria bacterium GW2011_GWA1_39_8]|jgi:hypothetical protein|uniref:Uncharacterized protein n=1 Tax=Candidatus Woesebacteria bacterium GW2011_GWA1_39_8 TaxID=1618552 RepID=A0A0G0PK46_9BACT|nr:MAG: hypothetical protein UT61_C0053G0009 [Candidatus Woesebacteria bacterium GW2011_GWA1_39_8]